MNQLHSSQKRLPYWVRTGIPVTISAIILYFYLFKQDWHQILYAAQNTNFSLAFLAILIPQVIIWFADVLITKNHFTWFHEPFPWKDYFWARGSLYLPLLINTALGSAGIAFYLYHKTHAAWAKLLGILFFRCILTIWAITMMMIPATLAMHYWGLTKQLNVNPYVLWLILILFFTWFIAAWMTWHHNTNVLRLRHIYSEFWTAFREATRKQWIQTFIIGGIPVILLLVGIWVLAMTFGINIPFMEFIVAAPLMFLLSELPIAFAGFGTTTMAWFLFFGNYGDEAAITSFTVFLPSARLAARAIIAAISLPLSLKGVLYAKSFKRKTSNPM